MILLGLVFPVLELLLLLLRELLLLLRAPTHPQLPRRLAQALVLGLHNIGVNGKS